MFKIKIINQCIFLLLIILPVFYSVDIYSQNSVNDYIKQNKYEEGIKYFSLKLENSKQDETKICYEALMRLYYLKASLFKLSSFSLDRLEKKYNDLLKMKNKQANSKNDNDSNLKILSSIQFDDSNVRRLTKYLSGINYKAIDNSKLLYKIYEACSYLSFFYANQFNTIATWPEQEKALTKYYRGIFFFDNKQWSDCIKTIKDDNYPFSQIYLAYSYYYNGDKNSAIVIFNKIENSKNLLQKSELGKYYSLFKIPEKQNRGIELVKEANNKRDNLFTAYNKAKIFDQSGNINEAMNTYLYAYNNLYDEDSYENNPEFIIDFFTECFYQTRIDNFAKAKESLINIMKSLPISSAFLKVGDNITNLVSLNSGHVLLDNYNN
jgi:hypothetical protein